MKSLTVRLPEALVAEIEHESRWRRVSKSDVVRDRLQSPGKQSNAPTSMRAMAGDLIGCIQNDGLPKDLSSNKKKYLPELILAHKRRHRR